MTEELLDDPRATIRRLTEERDQARGYLAEIAAATAEQGQLFVDAAWHDDWPAAIAWLKKHISLTPEGSMLAQHQEAVNSWRAYAKAAEQERDDLRERDKKSAIVIESVDRLRQLRATTRRRCSPEMNERKYTR